MADRIVALRDGGIAGAFEKKPLDYEGAVNAMLGRKVSAGTLDLREAGVSVFTAKGLQIEPGARPFSLSLGDGEVVAVAGLVGVGKTALAETLFGIRRPLAGSMRLAGSAYQPASPKEAIAAGVFLVAKDRARERHRPRLQRLREHQPAVSAAPRPLRGVAAPRRARRRPPSDRRPRHRLPQREGRHGDAVGRQPAEGDGGALDVEQASLFILDEPFQGVDIAARRDIAAKLRASAAGRATLIFVTELDEALETADRILVMSEHTIVGDHRNQGLRMERLLAEIAGQPVRGVA